MPLKIFLETPAKSYFSEIEKSFTGMEQLRNIGIIHSGLKKKEDCPLQENEDAPGATTEIYPEFLEGIKDIKPGSEILLLTWLHQADRSVIKCFPRRNYKAPEIGGFSTRSPDRPNPIGSHSVKVVAIEENGFLKVS